MKTAEQKLNYLQSLRTSHIHFSDFFRKVEDVENLKDFDGVVEYLQDSGAVYVDIVYYHEAIKYLKENDPSLFESLEIANMNGYDLDMLNSEILASLHASEAHRAELYELAEEINNTFADIEAGEYIG